MKAILFDMDGVLVDSMHYHAEAWDTTLKTIGITIDKKIIYEQEKDGGIIVDNGKTTLFDIRNSIYR